MIRMVCKKMFFDRKAVTSRVSNAARKVLSKFGAFVRTTAKQSIRKRKRSSAPGEPPSSHAGLLKKFIYFGYDPARKSVVIGPQRLNQKIGDAPAALEHGGSSTIVEGLRPYGRPSGRGRRRKRRVRIMARPFMGPAFEQEKPKLPAMWAGSVR